MSQARPALPGCDAMSSSQYKMVQDRLIREKGGLTIMARQHYPEDTYTKESFTLRGMRRWQAWSISVVAILLVIAALSYTL